MTAEIHRLQSKPIAVEWMCSACGVDAGCNCGAPLMSKAQRAAKEIAANPHKSNRAIAEEVGVSEGTVRTARKSGAQDYAPDEESRTGRDGKTYKMPVRQSVIEDDEDDDIDEVTPSQIRKAFLIYANEAMLLAKYDGPVNGQVLAAARATASAWSRLVSTMEQAK